MQPPGCAQPRRFLSPIIALGVGIYLWIKWRGAQPKPFPPIGPVVQAAEDRVIAANFPNSETFTDGFLRRLLQSWEHQVPVYLMLSPMLAVANALYEHEGLFNPLPPIGSTDLIADGAYRDGLARHVEKMRDAPRTLPLFSEALERSFRCVRDALPASLLQSESEIWSRLINATR